MRANLQNWDAPPTVAESYLQEGANSLLNTPPIKITATKALAANNTFDSGEYVT